MSWNRSPLAELSFGRARHTPTPLARATVWLLAIAVIGLEIGYPLVHGDRRDQLTVAVVLTFAAFSALHAAFWRGWAWALGLVVLAAGVGFGVEALGVATGIPFGDYHYADTLGTKALDVPVIIPAAWLMMAYPALLIGRRLASGRLGQVLIGGWALASWDLFLDPQMTDAGHWTWDHPSPHLPGVPDVPLTDYLGWLVVALLLMWLLTLLPSRRANDTAPFALWIWTWLSSVLAFLVFFDMPWVALWGGVGMALVGIPLLLSVTAQPAP
jgi:putative membrane protein